MLAHVDTLAFPTALRMAWSCVPAARMLQEAYVSIRCSIRQHTSAYAAAYVSIRCSIRQHTLHVCFLGVVFLQHVCWRMLTYASLQHVCWRMLTYAPLQRVCWANVDTGTRWHFQQHCDYAMALREQTNQEVELVYHCRLVSGNTIHFTTALLLHYYGCTTTLLLMQYYLSSADCLFSDNRIHFTTALLLQYYCSTTAGLLLCYCFTCAPVIWLIVLSTGSMLPCSARVSAV